MLETLILLGGFFIGALVGMRIPDWIGARQKSVKKPDVLAVIDKVPEGRFVGYTLEELRSHKVHLEHEHKSLLHYPALRSAVVRDLSEVTGWIDKIEMSTGEYALRVRKEEHKREIAEFDAEYKSITGGHY